MAVVAVVGGVGVLDLTSSEVRVMEGDCVVGVSTTVLVVCPVVVPIVILVVCEVVITVVVSETVAFVVVMLCTVVSRLPVDTTWRELVVTAERVVSMVSIGPVAVLVAIVVLELVSGSQTPGKFALQ